MRAETAKDLKRWIRGLDQQVELWRAKDNKIKSSTISRAPKNQREKPPGLIYVPGKGYKSCKQQDMSVFNQHDKAATETHIVQLDGSQWLDAPETPVPAAAELTSDSGSESDSADSTPPKTFQYVSGRGYVPAKRVMFVKASDGKTRISDRSDFSNVESQNTSVAQESSPVVHTQLSGTLSTMQDARPEKQGGGILVKVKGASPRALPRTFPAEFHPIVPLSTM